MLEIIKNLPKWVKITGVSVPVILLFLIILYFHGESEAIELPSKLDEIKENVTEQTMDEATESGAVIISEFSDAGKELAKDVNDPVAKKTIEFGMTFAGVMLALCLVMVTFLALKKAFGS